MWATRLVLFALQVFTVSAKLRTYNWNIGWVSASPDGFTRPFVGINGQWPCPTLNVTVGDIIKINVVNQLGNESTAIHFHGLYQRGTNMMDGPAAVTQCPIQPGGTFVYEFTVNQTGTYWYHAHIGGQYIDGFRGPLVVTDPKRPFHVDKEYVLTVSDLYHQEAPPLINYYQSADNYNNNQGAEPVPDSVLINEAQGGQFSIVPGKTYLFRIISMAAMMPFWVQFDQHNMTIVEVDGVYVTPVNVDRIFIAAAQRYSVLVTAKADKSSNFAIVAQMNQYMLVYPWLYPQDFNPATTAYLVYDATLSLPNTFTIDTGIMWDDTQFFPLDNMPLLSGTPDVSIQLLADFGGNANSQQRANFNGQSFTPQKVPTLYTALTAPADQVMNPAIYGAASNPYVIPYGSLVEVTIANHDFNAHPFHLHGHAFQVVDRSAGGYYFPGMSNPYPASPMRRDTIVVYSGQYATLRFIADNPGIQLFHCHIEWHVEAGLTATFIEAPEKLQQMKPFIPTSHKNVCKAQNIAMKGNAAGNVAATKKVPGGWLNLTGAYVDPPINPWGALVNPPAAPAKRWYNSLLSLL